MPHKALMRPRPFLRRCGRMALFAGLVLGLAVLALGISGIPSSDALAQPQGAVWVTEAEGIVDPPLADYLEKVIGRAEDAQAEALVILMDTPGGLDTSMRQIIQAELDADIPVVVYVYPNGARAASAGVYIMMGADVTAMAPQTNLGAATPVSLSGEMGETLTRKVINDSVAYIRALADEHGRNADWAEQAVRNAESLPATEAEQIGVIEFLAEDLDTLLQELDGFETVPKGFTLQTADAPTHRVEMNWAERFLHLVVNPNFAYIFLMVGVLGIVLELQSPGIGFGGIVGGISLLLGLYALSVLPVNLVGVALLILAAILFVAEIFVISGGILAIGGVAAMILGGMLLFDAPGGVLRVDWSVIILTSLATLAFFAFVIRAVARARRRRLSGGLEAMVGAQGRVRQVIDPVGQVMVHGELWRAQADRSIGVGSAVTVKAIEGLTLTVEQTDEDESPADGQRERPAEGG